MTRFLPFVSAALAATALAVAAPAFAQPVYPNPDHAMTGRWWNPSDVYGSIGYTGINQGSPSGAHIGAITGRVDARYGKYFGVEGELSGGVSNDHTRTGLTSSLQSQYAAYAVGYLPVLPNADLFARIGYGESNEKFKGLGGYSDTSETFNYGAGGQYFFNGHDGVRAEYTRQDAAGHFAPNADTVAVSYVRRF
jgi:outer membrane immunogenic protein